MNRAIGGMILKSASVSVTSDDMSHAAQLLPGSKFYATDGSRTHIGLDSNQPVIPIILPWHFKEQSKDGGGGREINLKLKDAFRIQGRTATICYEVNMRSIRRQHIFQIIFIG